MCAAMWRTGKKLPIIKRPSEKVFRRPFVFYAYDNALLGQSESYLRLA